MRSARKVAKAPHGSGPPGAPVRNPWRAVLSGACATLIGIGLARFAYTPLLPAVVDAGWFGVEAATYLAAANLGGYLLGVMLAEGLATRTSPITALRAMLVACTVSMVACAVPVNFSWFFAWRLISGVGGGVVMILAAPTILAHLPAGRRGLATGLVFMGIGLGVATSGALVPLLVQQGGPSAAWMGLAAASAALTVIAWTGWPATPPARREPHLQRIGRSPSLASLHIAYALNAVGLVPHMVFLSVFIAYGLGLGVDAGAFYWIVFGLGAVVGPLLSGHLADRAGYGAALRFVLLLEIIATATPALTSTPGALILSSLMMGAATPGIVPLVLGRVHELAGPSIQVQKAAWRTATLAFAAAQGFASYAFAYLAGLGGDGYRHVFAAGATALLLALIIELAGGVAFRDRGYPLRRR